MGETSKHSRCDGTSPPANRQGLCAKVFQFAPCGRGIARIACLLILFPPLAAAALPTAASNGPVNDPATAGGIDLLQRYPTHLVGGDDSAENARTWDFTGADIFRLSRFNFKTGKDLGIEIGAADVGIGHCKDGAVWAVVIPRNGGELTSIVTNRPENVSSIWLRFHPAEISHIFPPETVFADGATNLILEMRRVADHKIHSSWQAGGRAMIPGTNEMTVDVDTEGGPRRFFMADEQALTAQYVHYFEDKAVKPPPPITPGAAESAFDQLWAEYDSKYAMFALRTNVDWAKMREVYRPKALASRSTLEFAETCADMLKSLRDLHIWLTVAGDDVPVYNRLRISNANPAADEAILGSLNQEGNQVEWTVTQDKIGYIAIFGWDDPQVPDECQEALENMRDTRGLIVDVRLNGGGSEDQAMEFARRFVTGDFVYAYDQFRNGPAHTNLTEKISREIEPGGPWRYDRPVLVLIGQKCMSSNESFIGMMTGDTNAITMGDHTCGSSGNPEIIDLPMEMTVSVPQWIDYLPDGKTPVDEHGFRPHIPFKPMPGAFVGDRDDLLVSALHRLRQAPLPDKAIAGPLFVSEEEAEAAEATDNSMPKVISVFPANGAKSVDSIINLRVRFDRPMDPSAIKMEWKSGGFLDSDFPTYNSKTHEFTIPVHLSSGTFQEILLNRPFGGKIRDELKYFPRDGFQSADHHLAHPFTWEFKTMDAAPAPNAAAPPKVVKISPPSGSVVPYRLFLDVQFDQPMKSTAEALPYLVKSFELTNPTSISNIRYDATSHTFHLPLLLFPAKKSTVTLAGFYSELGIPSKPVKLEYEVSSNALSVDDQKRFENAEHDSRLLRTLGLMKRRRAKMTSVSEQVQTVSMYGGSGLFKRLTFESTSFEWQQPEQFYVEAADLMMNSAFAIGSDGKNCWWLNAESDATNLTACPVNEIQQIELSLCDPFDLMHETPGQAAAKQDLEYIGTAKLDRSKCDLLDGWGWDPVPPSTMTPIGFLTQWWIDRQTGRLLANEVFSEDCVEKTRYIYDSVNRRLPAGDFAVPKANGLSPTPPGPLGKGYTKRFIEVKDGGNGNMQLHFGRTGPKVSENTGFGNFE